MSRVVAIVLVLICASCQNNLPDKKELIEQYYNEHVALLEKQKLRECNERTLVDVESEIDSIIDNLINKDLLDSLNFPNKPLRPQRAKHIINKVDTFSVGR